MQTLTLSDYMHHNRLKFLICVAPKSSIVSICDLCLGRISDKKLTNSWGYLDTLEEYSEIMADKEFLLPEKWLHEEFACNTNEPSWSTKATKIANLQTLVEQVIRRFKCFRILANVMAIKSLQYVNGVLKVCAA